MTLHLFIVITILTALSLSSPAGFPVSAPTSISPSPRLALRGSSNDTLLSYDPNATNPPDFVLKGGVAIIGITLLIILGFLFCLVWSYLHSDERKEKKAAKQVEAGEDKGYEGGGKGDEGDGKAYEGEGKVN